MPKVSIIVPMYNVEKYIHQCINSFIEQTLQDIEIIIIDDGSRDNSGDIADEYAGKDARIKVLHKNNEGVSAARNDGLKMATGDYVIFCDSDDWMDTRACEVLYKAAIQNAADISIGDVYMSYAEHNVPIQFYKDNFVTKEQKKIRALIKADLNRTYCENPPTTGPAFGYGGPWNKLVRRKLLLENNIQFDVTTKGVFDDIIYTAYILASARCVCYTSYPMYYYRQLEGTITNSFKENTLEINEAIFYAWEVFFNKYDKNQEFREAYYACVLRRMVETIRLYYVNSKNPKREMDLKREYIQMIYKEPYKMALKKANIKKLNKKQMIVYFLSKKATIGILWSVFKWYYK